MSDIDTQIESLVNSMFVYGIDWTEYKDKSENDHEVATYAARIKTELKAEVTKAIKTLLIQSKIDELEKMKTEWGYGEYPMDNPRYGMDWEDWIDYRTQTLKSTTKEK